MGHAQEVVHDTLATRDCYQSAVTYDDTVVQELTARQTPGYAIGGLVGGEEKTLFVRTVSQVNCAAAQHLQAASSELSVQQILRATCACWLQTREPRPSMCTAEHMRPCSHAALPMDSP